MSKTLWTLYVTYLPPLCEAVGRSQEALKISAPDSKGISIRDLLKAIAGKHGSTAKDSMFAKGPGRELLVNCLVNGRAVQPDDLVRDKDHVVVLLALGGG